jgi:16S rRNA (guanine527-N7)-methyltransferase
MFHVKLESLGLPADAISRLTRYEGMLRERAIPLGIVAASDRDRLVERHIRDSLRALPALPEVLAAAADLGSGAGLPGIPVAIARPDLEVALVESRARKAGFLEWAVEALGLPNARVVHARIEQIDERFAVCMARALAGAPAAWALARRLLQRDGRLLYFAGSSWSDEEATRLREAGARVQSITWGDDPEAGPIVVMRSTDLE